MGHELPLQAWEIADLSLQELLKLDRTLSRADCERGVRIAVLGNCATQHYTKCLSAALKIRGFWPDIFEAEYDTIQQELLDARSGFHAHRPEFVVLFNCVQSLEEKFNSLGQANFSEEISQEIFNNWRTILASHESVILQHNFCLPIDFTFGNLTGSCRGSLRHAVARINLDLFAEAEALDNVRIVDIEFQAAFHGKKQWLDERSWCDAKQALSPKFLPPLVKVVSDVILQDRGVVTKCVVLDLDNTLWGGVLGDVGPHGVEIGEVNSMGIAFARFQGAIKRLKERGLVLAISSKNDQALAESVFENHPDMELHLDDIACFIADYNDKASNILKIKEKLNIGLDSFVFLDDSKFERDFVRSSLPEVQVPELPDDPSEFSSALANWNLFEARGFSDEDANRTTLYKTDEKRRQIREEAPDLASYLSSLQMVAEIEPFNDFTLPRVSQLVQRSNQFNLTTIRHEESSLRAFAKDKAGHVTFTVRLKDRLGDNGIVALVIGRKEGNQLVIDSWIMSCRVLGRRIEEATFQLIIESARELDCSKVIGNYVKTRKNALVDALFPRLGFDVIPSENDASKFVFKVDDYVPVEDLPIEIVKRDRDGG